MTTETTKCKVIDVVELERRLRAAFPNVRPHTMRCAGTRAAVAVFIGRNPGRTTEDVCKHFGISDAKKRRNRICVTGEYLRDMEKANVLVHSKTSRFVWDLGKRVREHTAHWKIHPELLREET